MNIMKTKAKLTKMFHIKGSVKHLGPLKIEIRIKIFLLFLKNKNHKIICTRQACDLSLRI